MKNKAALMLMEQLIMTLVLAAAAAVCLRVFVYADAMSKKNTAADAACIQAQSAAETLKACGGDMSAAALIYGGEAKEDKWIVGFDEEWKQTTEGAKYVLTAEKSDSETRYLGRARVSVCGEEELFSVEICWQED